MARTNSTRTLVPPRWGWCKHEMGSGRPVRTTFRAVRTSPDGASYRVSGACQDALEVVFRRPRLQHRLRRLPRRLPKLRPRPPPRLPPRQPPNLRPSNGTWRAWQARSSAALPRAYNLYGRNGKTRRLAGGSSALRRGVAQVAGHDPRRSGAIAGADSDKTQVPPRWAGSGAETVQVPGSGHHVSVR